MEGYEWLYQYSLFPALDGEDKKEDKIKAEELILSGLDGFRDRLRKKYPKVGILFMIRRGRIAKGFQARYRKDFQQLYVTWYASSEISEKTVRELVDVSYDSEVNLSSQRLTCQDVESKASAIKNQRLHNLSDYYDRAGKKFKRFTVINKSSLIKKNEVLIVK